MTTIHQKQKGNYIEISISIQGESKDRKIGRLKEGTLHIYRERDKHLMRKYDDSYGVNEEVLNSVEGIRNIEIEEKGGTFYRVPKSVFLLRGTVGQISGWDRQIFLPLDIIQAYKQEEV